MSECPPDADAWLVAAFRQEDPGYAAVEHLAGRIQRWVCHYHAPYKGEAKDIALETVLRISDHIDEFDNKARFFTWVCHFASYIVLEFHRKHQRGSVVSLEVLTPEQIMRLATDDSEEATILQMALEDAKAVLTDAEREAVTLRSDGLSFEEVGKQMGGLTANAARKRAYSGAAKMGQYLIAKEWIVHSPGQGDKQKVTASRKGITA